MDDLSATPETRRRSSRRDYLARIVVSGTDSRGSAFRASGETLEVSFHGARIRSSAPVETGMEVRVTFPARRQSGTARICWASPNGEFGIELRAPERFWGIPFAGDVPSERIIQDGPRKSTKRSSVETVHSGVVEVREPPPPVPEDSIDHPAAKPEQAVGISIPAEGIQVYVTGISGVHSSFQEPSVLQPAAENEATLSIGPLVDVGARLRVVFPEHNRTVIVRVTGLNSRRDNDKWRVWVELLGGFRFVRTDDGATLNG